MVTWNKDLSYETYAVIRTKIPHCSFHVFSFTLKKGRFICADPKQEWVPTLMKRVDKMKTYSITKVQKEFISASFNLNVS